MLGWAEVWPQGDHLFAMGWLIPIALVCCLMMMGVLLGIWRVFRERWTVESG